MAPRKQFYDPFVQAEPIAGGNALPEEPVVAINVPQAGIWFHVDDILRILGNDPVYATLRDYFRSTLGQLDEPVSDDPHPEVARIEVYPDPDGKWHARPVADDGSILHVTDGSFDRDWVERDAAERWPGKQLFEIADAMGDSIWDEQDHPFGFNGVRRPSPKRLWQ